MPYYVAFHILCACGRLNKEHQRSQEWDRKKDDRLFTIEDPQATS